MFIMQILVGVKFVRSWPFLGRVRLCFVEPPYFQMTVKPLIGHGLDVTEFPGISGWLDKLMDTAFGQTLVEPNMLVIDVEKFVSTPSGRRKLCFLLVFKESSFHSCCFPFNPPIFCVSFQQL
jgi:Ca2+-dependent lipid-binding protein